MVTRVPPSNAGRTNEQVVSTDSPKTQKPGALTQDSKNKTPAFESNEKFEPGFKKPNFIAIPKNEAPIDPPKKSLKQEKIKENKYKLSEIIKKIDICAELALGVPKKIQAEKRFLIKLVIRIIQSKKPDIEHFKDDANLHCPVLAQSTDLFNEVLNEVQNCLVKKDGQLEEYRTYFKVAITQPDRLAEVEKMTLVWLRHVLSIKPLNQKLIEEAYDARLSLVDENLKQGRLRAALTTLRKTPEIKLPEAFGNEILNLLRHYARDKDLTPPQKEFLGQAFVFVTSKFPKLKDRVQDLANRFLANGVSRRTTHSFTSSSLVETKELAKYAMERFALFDDNRDGFLDKAELSRAVENPNIKGSDAQIVAVLYHFLDKVSDLYDVQLDGNRISINDLKKLDILLRNQNDFLNSFQAATKYLDFNYKPSFDKAVIQVCLSRADELSLNQSERAGLTYILKNFDRIAKKDNKISRDELNRHLGKCYQQDSDLEFFLQVSKIVTSVKKLHPTKIANLYAKDLKNPVSSRAIVQGLIGDCYLMATLSSIASSHAEIIQNMIKQLPDGRYQVTFKGDAEHPIIVDPPTVAEAILYAQPSEYGMWPLIIERAFGLYKKKDLWNRFLSLFNNINNISTKAEGADGGGFLKPTMAFLTGSKTVDTDVFILNTQNSVKQKLINAFNAKPKEAVTAMITGSLSAVVDNFVSQDTKFDYTKDGFAAGHAYSVLAFDPNGKDGGTVTIRNPWGDDDDTPNGTIKISLEKFLSNFSAITYSG